MSVYDKIQKELIQKREKVTLIGDLPPSFLGDFYEDIIKDFTRQEISPKYGVYAGVIVKTRQNQISKKSLELDIIIIDESLFNPLFKSNNLIITEPDCVKVVIQVKSFFSGNNVTKAEENLASVKKIKREILTIFISLQNFENNKNRGLTAANIDQIICFSDKQGNLESGQLEKYVNLLKTSLP